MSIDLAFVALLGVLQWFVLEIAKGRILHFTETGLLALWHKWTGRSSKGVKSPMLAPTRRATNNRKTKWHVSVSPATLRSVERRLL